jgi:hypothetical protein
MSTGVPRKPEIMRPPEWGSGFLGRLDLDDTRVAQLYAARALCLTRRRRIAFALRQTLALSTKSSGSNSAGRVSASQV